MARRRVTSSEATSLTDPSGADVSCLIDHKSGEVFDLLIGEYPVGDVDVRVSQPLQGECIPARAIGRDK